MRKWVTGLWVIVSMLTGVAGCGDEEGPAPSEETANTEASESAAPASLSGMGSVLHELGREQMASAARSPTSFVQELNRTPLLPGASGALRIAQPEYTRLALSFLPGPGTAGSGVGASVGAFPDGRIVIFSLTVGEAEPTPPIAPTGPLAQLAEQVRRAITELSCAPAGTRDDLSALGFGFNLPYYAENLPVPGRCAEAAAAFGAGQLVPTHATLFVRPDGTPVSGLAATMTGPGASSFAEGTFTDR